MTTAQGFEHHLDPFTRADGSAVKPDPHAMRAASYDKDADTVDLVMSTGMRGRRSAWWGEAYDEELVVDEQAVSLDRFAAGAPVQVNHNYSVEARIGNIVPGTTRIEAGALVGVCRFVADANLSDDMRRVKRQIIAGELSELSVSYRVLESETVKPKDRSDGSDVPLVRVTRWEPLEVSVVGVPFDHKSHTRSAVAANLKHDEKKETKMPDEKKNLEQRHVDAPPAPDLEAIRAEAAEAERKRLMAFDDIEACFTGRVEPDTIARLVTASKADPKATADTLRAQLIDAMVVMDEKIETRHGLDVFMGTQPVERLGAAISSAIAHRMDGTIPATKDAADFRFASLVDIGRALLHARGMRPSSMSPSDVAGQMLERTMTTDDFPLLLADSVGKVLANKYQAVPQPWKQFCVESNARDFKTRYAVTAGDFPSFLEIAEGAGYKQGATAEKRESYALKTYGRELRMTRQMLINDDLGAFARIVAQYGAAAARRENAIVWGLLTSAYAMSDGHNLFDSTHHGNDSGGAGDPAVATLNAGFSAFASQTDIDGNPLDLKPRYLVVPSGVGSIAVKARQLLFGQVSPAAYADVMARLGEQGNSDALTLIETSYITDAQWYLIGDPAVYPTIEYSHLEGGSGVQIEEISVNKVEGVAYGAWVDFAAAPVDHRNVYRNGAAY